MMNRKEYAAAHSSFIIPHSSFYSGGYLSHAQGKTWEQAHREAQEDSRSGEGISRHEVEALPLGQRVGRARAEVRLHGAQAEEARLPKPLDRPHRSGSARQRSELLAVHARPQSRRNRTRPEGLGRPRRKLARSLRRTR